MNINLDSFKNMIGRYFINLYSIPMHLLPQKYQYKEKKGYSLTVETNNDIDHPHLPLSLQSLDIFQIHNIIEDPITKFPVVIRRRVNETEPFPWDIDGYDLQVVQTGVLLYDDLIRFINSSNTDSITSKITEPSPETLEKLKLLTVNSLEELINEIFSFKTFNEEDIEELKRLHSQLNDILQFRKLISEADTLLKQYITSDTIHLISWRAYLQRLQRLVGIGISNSFNSDFCVIWKYFRREPILLASSSGQAFDIDPIHQLPSKLSLYEYFRSIQEPESDNIIDLKSLIPNANITIQYRKYDSVTWLSSELHRFDPVSKMFDLGDSKFITLDDYDAWLHIDYLDSTVESEIYQIQWNSILDDNKRNPRSKTEGIEVDNHFISLF